MIWATAVYWFTGDTKPTPRSCFQKQAHVVLYGKMVFAVVFLMTNRKTNNFFYSFYWNNKIFVSFSFKSPSAF
jgi:hypothetical protein